MKFEDIIGYKFKDKALLRQCLSHKSFSNEFKVPNNERLEFLGDSVLSVIVSKYLFQRVLAIVLKIYLITFGDRSH